MDNKELQKKKAAGLIIMEKLFGIGKIDSRDKLDNLIKELRKSPDTPINLDFKDVPKMNLE